MANDGQREKWLEVSPAGFVIAAIIAVIFVFLQVGDFSAIKSWIGERLGHDEVVLVISENWANGEYKSCVDMNTKPVTLNCGGDRDGKLFKVEFHGLTFTEEQPPQTIFKWSCRKTNGEDVSIVCRRSAE